MKVRLIIYGEHQSRAKVKIIQRKSRKVMSRRCVQLGWAKCEILIHIFRGEEPCVNQRGSRVQLRKNLESQSLGKAEKPSCQILIVKFLCA